jgi:hypothetical protein
LQHGLRASPPQRAAQPIMKRADLSEAGPDRGGDGDKGRHRRCSALIERRSKQ